MAISADAVFGFLSVIVLGVVGFLLARLLAQLDDHITELQTADKARAADLAAFRLEAALYKQRVEILEAEVRAVRRPLT